MKKEKIIVISLIIILIVIMVGVTYAVFSYSKVGERINSITTGAISMEYTESDNIISMNKALPTTDATGKVRLTEGEYFDFTVKGVAGGNSSINYEIGAEEVGEGTIDGSNIKLYLTEIGSDGGETEVMSPKVYSEEVEENTYTGRPSGVMSLTTGTKTGEFTTKYRLRMYVTEEYNPQGDGGGLTFSIRVNVYGKEGEPVGDPVSDVIVDNVGNNGSTYDDGTDTFITGTDPNNYVWYSGKLWRVVSINNEAKTTKLVTQWNISAINYNAENNTAFEGSYMEDWLNDTSVDGFLGNLREPEKFIVMDAKWDATADDNELGSIKKPNGTTIATDPVGLLNMYEYQSSYHGTTYSNGYLNNVFSWWTLTPYSSSGVWYVSYYGNAYDSSPSSYSSGVRPSINLKSSVRIVDGDGTIDNPYRLNGDNDTNLSGTLLSSRYSGEYIRFGNDENNLYRIVSHETDGLTKIVSAEPLKSIGTFIKMNFGSNTTFSSSNTIGTFLNGKYLTNYVDSRYSDMIEDSTTWYLGTVGSGSYKNAKYTDASGTVTTSSVTTAKVGLLRFGELMSGQFDRYGNITSYWTLTPYSSSSVRYVGDAGSAGSYSPSGDSYGVRPSLNLKSNVEITSGTGTKNNPFTIELSS